MNKLQEDWNKLTQEEQNFVEKVYNFPGGKYEIGPQDKDLFINPEKYKFIEIIGRDEYSTSEKYWELVKHERALQTRLITLERLCESMCRRLTILESHPQFQEGGCTSTKEESEAPPPRIYPYCGFPDCDEYAALKYTEKECTLYLFTEKKQGEYSDGDLLNVSDFICNYLISEKISLDSYLSNGITMEHIQKAPPEIIGSFLVDDIHNIGSGHVCKFTFTAR